MESIIKKLFSGLRSEKNTKVPDAFSWEAMNEGIFEKMKKEDDEAGYIHSNTEIQKWMRRGLICFFLVGAVLLGRKIVRNEDFAVDSFKAKKIVTLKSTEEVEPGSNSKSTEIKRELKDYSANSKSVEDHNKIRESVAENKSNGHENKVVYQSNSNIKRQTNDNVNKSSSPGNSLKKNTNKLQSTIKKNHISVIESDSKSRKISRQNSLKGNVEKQDNSKGTTISLHAQDQKEIIYPKITITSNNPSDKDSILNLHSGEEHKIAPKELNSNEKMIVISEDERINLQKKVIGKNKLVDPVQLNKSDSSDSLFFSENKVNSGQPQLIKLTEKLSSKNISPEYKSIINPDYVLQNQLSGEKNEISSGKQGLYLGLIGGVGILDHSINESFDPKIYLYSETGLISPYSGLHVKKIFENKFNVRVGIEWQKMRTYFHFRSDSMTKVLLEDAVIARIHNQITGAVTYERGDTLVDAWVYTRVKHVNSYTLINIPILFGYNIYRSRWSAGAAAGVNINVSTHFDGRISFGNWYSDTAELSDLWKPKAGLAFIANINGGFQINSKYSLIMECSYQKYFNKWWDYSVLDRKPGQFKAGVGIEYKF